MENLLNKKHFFLFIFAGSLFLLLGIFGIPNCAQASSEGETSHYLNFFSKFWHNKSKPEQDFYSLKSYMSSPGGMGSPNSVSTMSPKSHSPIFSPKVDDTYDRLYPERSYIELAQIFKRSPQYANFNLREYQCEKEGFASGSYGDIYKCCHLKIPSMCLVKKVLTAKDAIQAQKIRAEIEMMGALTLAGGEQHHVLPLLGFKEGKKWPFQNQSFEIYMPLAGETIQKKPNKTNAYAPKGADYVSSLLWNLFDAVAFMHSVGLVHRDIKPENIFQDCANNNKLWLADFGLSQYLDFNLDEIGGELKVILAMTLQNTIRGTAPYIPPEVGILENGPATTKVDVYALGVILLEKYLGEKINTSDIREKVRMSNKEANQLHFNLAMNSEVEKLRSSPKFKKAPVDSLEFLIYRMLENNALDRIGLPEIFQHPALKTSLKKWKESMGQFD